MIYALAVCLLAACSAPLPGAPAPTTTGMGESGIYGQATLGPSCPVERLDDPCPDQPYQASFVVLDAQMRPVTEFATDVQGDFRVSLPPGEYTLRAERKAPFPMAPDRAVTVTTGEYIEVNVRFDSGIR